MSPFDVFAFFLCLMLAVMSRISLVRLFIYTVPYIAGNLLYSVAVPVNIGRISGFVIIGMALSGLVQSRSPMRLLVPKAVWLLTATAMITLCGLVWVLAFSDNISLWAQSPLERAVRGTARQVTFWLVPIGVALLIRNAEECRMLLRDFIKAGVFYTVLGLVQFVIGITSGIDIFPIIRGSTENLQTMVGGGNQGRITSICGEPRFFSSYLSVWFVFLLMCGTHAGLRQWQIRVLSLVFLATNVLTGARSGLAELVIILALMVVLSFWQANKTMRRQTAEILAYSLLTVVGIVFTQGLTLKDRIAVSGSTPIEVAGFQLPIEFQDEQAIRLLIDQPVALLFGFGEGLWQYATNPNDSVDLRQGTFDRGVTALDSMRQNIGGLVLLVNFGLAGVWLVIRFYRSCLKVAAFQSSQVTARQFRPVAVVLVVVTYVPAATDIYCNLMCFVVLTLWLETSMERRAAARSMAMQVDRLPEATSAPIIHATVAYDVGTA